MTKNAITVIDQELIDWFDNSFVIDINNPDVVTEKVEELLSMAKDLIEINAEITKRAVKVECSLAVCANYLGLTLDNSHTLPCESVKIMREFLDSVNEELKAS